MTKWIRALAAAPVLAAGLSASAHAEIVLSQLVVEVPAARPARQDVEIWNSGSDKAYVSITPAEIVGAGSASENRQTDRDPAKLGLLVSPARMILEPGQRKIVRIAPLGAAPERERIYRVTVKPEVGEISGDQSGLKILVGYDVLTIVRPTASKPQLTGRWSGSALKITNEGNASAELTAGQLCAPSKSCTSLPGKRLYAGASWDVPTTEVGTVQFDAVVEGKHQAVRF